MPKPTSLSGKKNLINQRLIEIRKERQISQRDLARMLQLVGYDIDKNVITRIETGKRYVTDIELNALCQVLDLRFDYLIEKDI